MSLNHSLVFQSFNPLQDTLLLNITLAEQSCQHTIEANGVGFSGCDAEILSSFADQFKQKGSLSEKQMALVFKKMPRYWNQIRSLIDKDKLEKLVVEEIKA